MPITYEVDEGNRIILSTIFGHVTAAELESTAHEAMGDARINAGYSHLIDMDMVQSADIPSDVISSTARATTEGRFLKDGKTAIVASQDYLYALGRMYQSYSEIMGREIAVFRSRQEAEKWLGIDRGAQH